jgi:hypothetical protein
MSDGSPLLTMRQDYLNDSCLSRASERSSAGVAGGGMALGQRPVADLLSPVFDVLFSSFEGSPTVAAPLSCPKRSPPAKLC